MNEYRVLFIFLALSSCMALSADTNTTKSVFTPTWGLSFQIENVSLPLTNNTDGVTAGLGARFWPIEILACRAVLFLDYTYIAASAQSQFRGGLSLGAEWHFMQGAVSPYIGLLGGINFLIDSSVPSVADYHAGAMIGLEMKPAQFLAFFVEYTLLAEFSDTGTRIDLGYNHLPAFGVIFYFN